MRILTVAHNHSSFHPGGTEVVAEGLHRTYADRDGIEAMLVAGLDPVYRRAHAGTYLQGLQGSPDVMLVRSQGFDVFQQHQTRFDSLLFDLKWFLEDFRPDVVHIHHLNHFGVEFLALLRQVLPQAVIVYTLHDYYLICPQDGLMLTNGTNRLCSRASPDSCHACFPERPGVVFQVRKQHIQRHLSVVDVFTAPSAFIRDRFIDWGLPASRIKVIRNGRTWPAVAAKPAKSTERRRNRFGVFGNLRRTKGTQVAAEAAVRLVEAGFTDFTLDLFGESLFQLEDFKTELAALVQRANGQIRCHGRFDQSELPRLMQQIDWVMVPSTWWENAPLAIADAFCFGRPVICSDIGGMAEAVTHGTDGLHVRAGDVAEWAETMRHAATDDALWSRLAAGVSRPPSVAETADSYLALFDKVQAGRSKPSAGKPSNQRPSSRSSATAPRARA